MSLLTTNTELLNKFGKHSIFIGFVLIIIGFTGILAPEVMSLEAAVFIAVFMLVGGSFWAIHTYQSARKSVMDWLKPLILIAVAGLMLVSPDQSIAALGLFIAFYLMMDAFSSFAMAQAQYPVKGWGWMLTNGIMSVLLALIFLFGWPLTSFWLVGLFVAISLLFDGLALVIVGWAMKDV